MVRALVERQIGFAFLLGMVVLASLVACNPAHAVQTVRVTTATVANTNQCANASGGASYPKMGFSQQGSCSPSTGACTFVVHPTITFPGSYGVPKAQLQGNACARVMLSSSSVVASPENREYFVQITGSCPSGEAMYSGYCQTSCSIDSSIASANPLCTACPWNPPITRRIAARDANPTTK